MKITIKKRSRCFLWLKHRIEFVPGAGWRCVRCKRPALQCGERSKWKR